jgi:hypothetical protein
VNRVRALILCSVVLTGGCQNIKAGPADIVDAINHVQLMAPNGAAQQYLENATNGFPPFGSAMYLTDVNNGIEARMIVVAQVSTNMQARWSHSVVELQKRGTTWAVKSATPFKSNAARRAGLTIESVRLSAACERPEADARVFTSEPLVCIAATAKATEGGVLQVLRGENVVLTQGLVMPTGRWYLTRAVDLDGHQAGSYTIRIMAFGLDGDIRRDFEWRPPATTTQ